MARDSRTRIRVGMPEKPGKTYTWRRHPILLCPTPSPKKEKRKELRSNIRNGHCDPRTTIDAASWYAPHHYSEGAPSAAYLY